MSVVNLWQLHPEWAPSQVQPIDNETTVPLVAELLLLHLESQRDYILWRHTGWMQDEADKAAVSIKIVEFKATSDRFLQLRDNTPFPSHTNVRWELQPVSSD